MSDNQPTSLDSIDAILEGLRYQVLNRQVKEGEWQSEVWFEVTKNTRAAINRLLIQERIDQVNRIKRGANVLDKGGIMAFLELELGKLQFELTKGDR